MSCKTIVLCKSTSLGWTVNSKQNWAIFQKERNHSNALKFYNNFSKTSRVLNDPQENLWFLHNWARLLKTAPVFEFLREHFTNRIIALNFSRTAVIIQKHFLPSEVQHENAFQLLFKQKDIRLLRCIIKITYWAIQMELKIT